MTVQTPFPGRPATPFWDPRGMGALDPSEITGDITDVFRTVYSTQPGMLTVQNADGSVTTYRQPDGNMTNLPVGNLSGQLATSLQTSGNSGILVLLGIGALVFFMSRGK